MLGNPLDTQSPDLSDPIVGWRAWTLVRSYGEWILQSPDKESVWSPGQALRATCPANHETQAQREACNCGINAFDSKEQLFKEGYSKHPVIGQVNLWGEVTKYNKGWRGQWGAPIRLILQMEASDIALKTADDLARLYGVPVEITPRAEPKKPAKTAATQPAVATGSFATGMVSTPSAVSSPSVTVTPVARPSLIRRAANCVGTETLVFAAQILTALAVYVSTYLFARSLFIAPAEALKHADVPALHPNIGLLLLMWPISSLAAICAAHGVGVLGRRIGWHPSYELSPFWIASFLVMEVALGFGLPHGDSIDSKDVLNTRLVPPKATHIAYDSDKADGVAGLLHELGLKVGDCQLTDEIGSAESNPVLQVCRKASEIVITRPAADAEVKTEKSSA